jgi:hypothetical protein
MTLKLKEAKVDNLRNYPRDVVEKLSGLLTAGAEAQVDTHRKGFYDVYNGSRVFFIHISPVSGNVMLLASWLTERAKAAAA